MSKNKDYHFKIGFYYLSDRTLEEVKKDKFNIIRGFLDNLIHGRHNPFGGSGIEITEVDLSKKKVKLKIGDKEI